MPAIPVSDVPRRPAALATAGGRCPAPPRLDSRDLFAGTPEVVIAHGGEHYRLRITRQGKLILTK